MQHHGAYSIMLLLFSFYRQTNLNANNTGVLTKRTVFFIPCENNALTLTFSVNAFTKKVQSHSSGKQSERVEYLQYQKSTSRRGEAPLHTSLAVSCESRGWRGNSNAKAITIGCAVAVVLCCASCGLLWQTMKHHFLDEPSLLSTTPFLTVALTEIRNYLGTVEACRNP